MNSQVEFSLAIFLCVGSTDLKQTFQETVIFVVMKQRFLKILSLCLAFLIGISSLGYSADLHFCQGKLKSVAFFGVAKSCHQSSCSSKCGKKEDLNLSPLCDQEEERNCCDNEKVSGSFEYDVVLVSFSQSEEKQDVYNLPVLSSFDLFTNSEVTLPIQNNTQGSDPPDQKGQFLRVLFCSFLC